MRRIRPLALLGLLASLVAALLVSSSLSQATSTTYISYAQVRWHHNTSQYPDRVADISALYYGRTSDSQALAVSSFDLACYGWSNNTPDVDGTRLQWGGKAPGGDFNVKWSASAGGNVPNCGGTNHESSPGDEIDPSNRILHAKWNFNARYPQQNNDSVLITVTFSSAGGCYAAIESGPGSLVSLGSLNDTCIATRLN